MNDVVVTGVGVVSSIANDKYEYIEALKKGLSGIDRITKYDVTNDDINYAGEVKNLNFSDYISRKDIKKYGLASKFGIVTAKQAINDANLEITEDNTNKIAIISASALGEIDQLLSYHDILFSLNNGDKRGNLFNNLFTNDVISSSVAIALGVKGINFSVSSGCCSFSVALIQAIQLLKANKYSQIILCGSEAPINKTVIKTFQNSNLLTKEKIRPFDKNSDGFLLGEGSSTLVLELEKTAKQRGVTPYCKISGFAATCDAFSLYSEAPTLVGQKSAIKTALKMSNNYKIDYINPYGCAIKYIDNEEITLLKDIFGDNFKDIYISSTKALTGHLLGASAGIEILSVILSIKYGFLVPNINGTSPVNDINLVKKCDKNINIKRALKLSHGSGNKNTAIILEAI